MIIITGKSSPRIEYIFRFVLESVLGYNIRFNEEPASGEAVLVYMDTPPQTQSIHIVPHGLLTQNDITSQEITMTNWEDLPVFFDTDGQIPFDLFAAAFYLVTRYEEYLPHNKDEYGRYAHKESLACRQGFLTQPLVDQWAMKLKDKISRQFPQEIPEFRKFSFTPTYDIDHAWLFRHRGLMRTVAHFGRDFLGGEHERNRLRLRVLRGKEKDPYDIYEWLDALHLRYGLKPIYFFPLAIKVKGYDRNISPFKPALKHLLVYHATGYKTGIHPSWQSGDSISVFNEELTLFEAITGSAPVYSRFHYIRFNLPEGYRKLVDAGISEDHSMGYGTANGFRASTSHAFIWYNLSRDTVTNLKVYPYCWMDANSYYEQKFTPAQAYDELGHYYDVVKKVCGNMEIISHNNFVSTGKGFAGWKEVYEIFLDQVVYWEL